VHAYNPESPKKSSAKAQKMAQAPPSQLLDFLHQNAIMLMFAWYSYQATFVGGAYPLACSLKQIAQTETTDEESA